jgi:hypothetical protein
MTVLWIILGLVPVLVGDLMLSLAAAVLPQSLTA